MNKNTYHHVQNMSGGTASELNLFKTLTNPGRTDFARRGVSVVERALEGERNVEHRSRDERAPREDERPKSRVGEERATHVDERATHVDEERATHVDERPGGSRVGNVREDERAGGEHATRAESRTGSPPAPVEDETCEKQALLLELHQLERDGVHLTQHFTMDASASDLLFELNRIRSNLDTASSVSMMTDGLQLGMKGVEIANSRWGPVLHLDGWSNVVDQDRERYTRVLTKLYKKHWRRGAMMSPEAELAMLLGGSAFLHHFQHKMGANPADSGGMFGGLGNIMNMFSGKGGGAPPPPPPPAEGLFTQRPTMRRPTPRQPSPPSSPPPSPPINKEMNEEINSLRSERAVLQAQLRAQAASFASPFVVQRRGGGPSIEELS